MLAHANLNSYCVDETIQKWWNKYLGGREKIVHKIRGSKSISDTVTEGCMVHGIPWCPCRSVFGSNDSAARLTFLAAGGMATSVAFNKGQNVSQIISTAHWSVMCLCKTLLTQRNRFKSVYSAWPLLPINVVSLNTSFHPCSFQAANALSPLSQSS